jgi:hypothetical protein
MTREPLSVPEARPTRRARVLEVLGRALQAVLPWLTLVAAGAAAVRAIVLARRRRWNFPLTVTVAAGGGCAAYLLIQAMLQVTSFPVMVVSSFAPVYPLLSIFVGIAFADALSARREPRSIPAAPSAAPDPGEEIRRRFPLPSRWEAFLPWVAGLAALAPFAIWHASFARLFWFGDDYFLVDELAQMGFWKWTWQPFTESFVPVFKLCWGGVLLGTDGSYGAMLLALWLTHAANTVMLGRLLLRAGFAWPAALATQLVFALTPANLETLGWSVQWSAILATSFLLAGLLWHETRSQDAEGWNWRRHFPLVLFAAASAGSFSRGVLTGGILALAVLAPALERRSWAAWRPRLVPAALCLLPALAVAAIIMTVSSGNHRHMAGHWAEAITYAAGFFLLNPGYLLFGFAAPGVVAALACGGAKLGCLAWGFGIARGRVRTLLLLLFVYDVGNAVLLGIGRYHTGFVTALGPRYYYSSLLATLPFAALCLTHALSRAPLRASWRTATAGLLALVLAWAVARRWPAELKEFTGWRGTELRALMAAPTVDDPSVRVPALEFMHVERAKALIRAYDLH